jgi:menaquinone-9 beta-reductase
MAAPEARVWATLEPDEAEGDVWDLLVIGAGPAGAMAAREAARAGARVLLVDRAVFPRPKVCGCCINGAAIAVLSDVGLGDLLDEQNAQQLRYLRLASAGRFAEVRLSDGVSLSRERFDAALVRSAIDAGAQFLDQTQASIGQATPAAREVLLKAEASENSVSARTIVVAGGLGCRAFAETEAEERRVAPGSRVGAGTILGSAHPAYTAGTIYMACHRHGYVGLVRLEDERLDIAAALDARAIRQHAGIAPLVQQILTDAGLPVPDVLPDATWQGTGRLTQDRGQIAAARCFFIGDAAGYVEPFTGEGLAWALASGRAVAPIVLRFLQDELRSTASQEWIETHHRLIARRARLCRCVTCLLRYPALVRLAVRLLAFAPALARPVVHALNRPFHTRPAPS